MTAPVHSLPEMNSAQIFNSGTSSMTSILIGKTAAQIAALSASQIASLTASDIAVMTPAQATALTASQLGVLSTGAFSAFSAPQIAAINTASVSAITAAQMSVLSAAQIASVTQAQFAKLSGTQIAAITVTGLAGLTATQMGWLTSTQVAALTQSQIATLKATQVAGIINIAAMTTTQIGTLTVAGFQALSAQNLSVSQLASFTAVEVGNLTVAQISRLSATQLNGLGSRLASLTVAQESALTAAQINGLSKIVLDALPVASLLATQLSGLTAATIGNLSASQIGGLSLAQIGSLSVAGFQALAPSALTVAQVTGLTATEVGNLSASQIGGLSVAQLAGLGSKLAGLTAAQESGITASQIAGMSSSTFGSLNLGNLTAAQLGGVSASDLASLSAASFDKLAAKLASINAAAFSGVSVADLQGLSAAQIATLTSAQIHNLSAAAAAYVNLSGVAAELASCETNGALTFSGAEKFLQYETSGGLTASKFSALEAVGNSFNTTGGVAASGMVAQLYDDVVLGNSANAKWTGGANSSVALGNMSATSTATQASELIGKWFLGTDDPSTAGFGITDKYVAQTGSLWAGTPSYSQVNQGDVGDCYFESAMCALADENPTYLQSLITDDGNGVYTVDFYNGQTQKNDYVTVDNAMPTMAGSYYDGSHLNFDNGGANGPIWSEVLEKAYVEFRAQSSGTNSYASIAGGWDNGLEALTGQAITDYFVQGETAAQMSSALSAIQTALTSHNSVMMADSNANSSIGLVGGHMYNVLSVNASAGTVAYDNPWNANGFANPASAVNTASVSALAAAGCSFSVASGAMHVA
jgi:hypothetical protein